MTRAKAKEVIEAEIQGLKDLSRKLDGNFEKAVDILFECRGRVVVTGMGKTGIIGRKISSTLSSTGTKSIFLHSAEAVHGDLGQVAAEDVVIIISSSGETEETKRLLPLLKRIHAKIIALTGGLESALAKHSDVVLDVGVAEEGCPLGLAPMASTTATLVMGDALAACLIVRKQFKREDFAFYHPGGALGRRLLLKVEDLMRRDSAYARVRPAALVKDVLLAITKARCGSACVVDENENFVGIFTDGDLRRHLETDPEVLGRPVAEVMTKNPMNISGDRLAAEALTLLNEKKIDELPVINEEGRLVGLLDVQDIIKAGLL